ncbi:MAG TPA: hypothetical protein PLI60_00875, partial [Anaerolineaceae bacterium]|nr:hypothetical protein [Anaerolineaceae bacterium]
TVYEHLEEDGVMVINVGRAPDDRRLINALSSTILAVFPSIYAVDLPGTFNTLLYATRESTTVQNLYNNFARVSLAVEKQDLLLTAGSVAVANLQPAPEPGQVFTDDKAPIEWITNNMVLHFLSTSSLEGLEQ